MPPVTQSARLHSHSQQQVSTFSSCPSTSTPPQMFPTGLCWHRCSCSQNKSPCAALISLKDNTAGERKRDSDLAQHKATGTAVLAQHSRQEQSMHPATEHSSITPSARWFQAECHSVTGRPPFLTSTLGPHTVVPPSGST